MPNVAAAIRQLFQSPETVLGCLLIILAALVVAYGIVEYRKRRGK